MKIQSSTIYHSNPIQFTNIYKGSVFEDLYKQSIEEGCIKEQKQNSFTDPWQNSACGLEGEILVFSTSRGGGCSVLRKDIPNGY